MKTSVLTHATMELPVGFWLLLLVLSGNINGFYCNRNKSTDLNVTDGSWKLVKVEPKEIATLADLADGIYSVEISGGRSQACGLGSGGILLCID
jgi:hypothetical protein